VAWAYVTNGAYPLARLAVLTELRVDQRRVRIAMVKVIGVVDIRVVSRRLIHDCGEVGRAVEITYGLHPIRLILVAADGREDMLAPGGAEERDQVSAGGLAPDADVVRVKAVLCRMRPQPADRR